jgi:hypothetical protein
MRPARLRSGSFQNQSRVRWMAAMKSLALRGAKLGT